MNIFIKNSTNTKISGKYKAAATYAPIKNTCPPICELKDAGCYAQASFVGIHNKILEKNHKGFSAEECARIEATAIDAAWPRGVPQDGPSGGRDLRLHVSGDCRTIRSATIVSAAARRYIERGGGRVWVYTHVWRNVPRNSWKGVSALASIKSLSDVLRARKQGYASAIVVPYHKTDRKHRIGNYNFIPCPAQTYDNVSCVDCGLCLDSNRLLNRKINIAFAAHGNKSREIKRRLKVIK